MVLPNVYTLHQNKNGWKNIKMHFLYILILKSIASLLLLYYKRFQLEAKNITSSLKQVLKHWF